MVALETHVKFLNKHKNNIFLFGYIYRKISKLWFHLLFLLPFLITSFTRWESIKKKYFHHYQGEKVQNGSIIHTNDSHSFFFSSLLLFSVTYTHVIFPVNFASFSIRQIPASLPPPNVEVLIRNVALIHLAIIRSRGFFSYPRKTIQSITTRFASCHADFNPTSRIQREARQNAPYNTPTIFTTMIRNSKRSWFFPSSFPSHATRVILNKNKRRRRRRRKRLFVLDFSPGPAPPLPPHVFSRFSNVNWEILPPSSTSN